MRPTMRRAFAVSGQDFTFAHDHGVNVLRVRPEGT